MFEHAVLPSDITRFYTMRFYTMGLYTILVSFAAGVE
jgi:hypothetical protein